MKKSINRFIKLYTSTNVPFVIDIDSILYIELGKLNSICENNIGYFTINHSVEKIQQMIYDTGYPCNFIYLHDSVDSACLVNVDYIHSISKSDRAGYSTKIKLNVTNDNSIHVVESITNVYKKITELKNNLTYNNIDYMQDNLCVTNGLTEGMRQSSQCSRSNVVKLIEVKVD